MTLKELYEKIKVGTHIQIFTYDKCVVYTGNGRDLMKIGGVIEERTLNDLFHLKVHYVTINIDAIEIGIIDPNFVWKHIEVKEIDL